MRFTFTEDQRQFQASLKGFLEKECTAAHIRALWDTDSGRSAERWAMLGELGLLGLLIPEGLGGLGMSEVDLVLLLEETGRAALPEPVVESAAVAVPLLAALEAQDLAERWLPRAATGHAMLTVGLPVSPLVSDAHVADLLLLADGDDVHAVPRERVGLESQPASDPSRRLFRVQWTPSASTRVAGGETGRRLLAAAFDRAALGAAAQLVGVGQRMVELAVDYARQREQFGRPIGSFQAIKHMLANVAVQLEFARPVVYRAAFSVARDLPTRARDVSHAKVAAGAAARRAAKAALQVHGAIGYTWEVDLQIWMKRAWALDVAWGTSSWHRARVAEAVLGPAPTR